MRVFGDPTRRADSTPIPRVSRDLIPRRGLTAGLEIRAPLTVVRGPGGSGKTTLVAAWANRIEDATVVWVTRTAAIDSRIAFWRETFVAMRAADAVLEHPGTPDGTLDDERLRSAIQNAFGSLGRPLVLVFDNFGAPGDYWEAVCGDLRSALAKYRHLQVVIIGRAPTGMASSEVGATIQTVVIDDAELQVTEEELRALAHWAGLDDADEDAVDEIAEAAGRLIHPIRILLETLSVSGEVDWTAVYGEMLHRIRENGDWPLAGVIATAHIVNVEIATRLTGRPTAEVRALLDEFGRLGLGSATTDADGRDTFEFLGHGREHLAAVLRSEQPALARKAETVIARWVRDHTSAVAAIDHAFDGGDFELLAELLFDGFLDIPPSYAEHLLDRLGELSSTELSRHPMTTMAFARLLSMRRERLAVSTRYFEMTTEIIKDRPGRLSPQRRFVLAGIESAALRNLGRLDDAVRAARRMLRADEGMTLQERAALRAMYPFLIDDGAISAYFAGDLPLARECTRRELEWSTHAKLPTRVNTALGSAALTESLAGRFDLAETYLRGVRADDWSAERLRDGRSGVAFMLAEAFVLLNRGDYEAAIGVILELEAGDPSDEHWAFAAAIRAIAAILLGGVEEAEAGLGVTSAAQVDSGRSASTVFLADALTELIRLVRGDGISAYGLRFAASAPGLSAVAQSLRAIRASGSGAIDVAAEALAAAELKSATPLEQMFVAIAGVRLTGRGGAGSLRAFAARIVTLVEAERLQWPIALLDADDRERLRAVIGQTPLRRSFDEACAAVPSVTLRVGEVVELTRRERDVLRGLATSTSRTEIATRLDVSANTVKSQIRTLYRKLGAKDRRSALQKAVGHGLIPSADIVPDSLDTVD